MNVPNTITVSRVVLIPVFVVVFYLPYNWSYSAAALIFAVAGITDGIDGYLARKLKQTTAFGAFLDPVADKLMVVTAIILLVGIHPTPLFAIPAAVIAGREIVVSALREWMAELGKRAQVEVSQMGKIKTAAQMGAITLFLIDNPFTGLDLELISYTLLYCATALTLWSMFIYLKAALPLLLDDEPGKEPSNESQDT
ncbi:MAG: CDP-diacylglycerol--glycerol-3-phosphate 3-phosphatidyltransferase [Pseudomonadales bacterium]|nr:CDP-diacylglycerol--glycerol-3-phosphate 3-phosphatidyltransferase [Pseudomonadales bacterium]